MSSDTIICTPTLLKVPTLFTCSIFGMLFLTLHNVLIRLHDNNYIIQVTGKNLNQKFGSILCKIGLIILGHSRQICRIICKNFTEFWQNSKENCHFQRTYSTFFAADCNNHIQHITVYMLIYAVNILYILIGVNTRCLDSNSKIPYVII